MSGMTLKELMETEIYKEAKTIKYIDKDYNTLNTKRPIVIANVLFRELQEDGTLLIMLWVENIIPAGWKRIVGATTAPIGFEWISNGKSLFDPDYKRALLRLPN